MAYRPETPNANVDQLTYLLSELERIGDALQLIEDGRAFPVRYAAPKRPRQGALYYADGTVWNPGSGQGLYRYNGVAFVFVG